ncbi:flagellar motor switch protein FliM [Betaproteobacteria bacterium GR16-43]|nr:flagellar motor switch protein FliM [Betaproteobacteria bacterium GR16-43]
MSEILSQDEVDALLRGVNGEADTPEEPAPQGGVRNYNLATQERIVRGRMPTLEIIHERFARLLRIGLFNFMRRSPEISVGPVRVLKYSEFVRNLVVPTNINLVQMKPLRGTALFIFDPSLVFSVVDNMFGGDGRFHMRVEGRDFTPTENRIIQKMLEVVFADYQKSWQPVFPVQFEYVRSEMHTQFANIATPTEIVICATFNIELGDTGGAFHVCLPYAMLEPIRDILYSSVQGDHMEPDKRWVRMLSKQVQLADVQLAANLTELPIKVGELMKLKVGDVLDFDPPRLVTASVDGVPVFECRHGSHNGQYAIRVERILSITPQENALGDEPAIR